MRWALLALVLVVLLAFVAAGSHGKNGKKELKAKSLEGKRADFKANHGKEHKKCHGKKCGGGADKYAKDKNKDAVEEARGKREAPAYAEEAKYIKKAKVTVDAAKNKLKSKKGKKVDPTAAKVEEEEVTLDVEESQPEPAKKAHKKASEKMAKKKDKKAVDAAAAAEEIDAVDADTPKKSKKAKRSADEAELPLSEKASKTPKKKAEELGKKKKAKKSEEPAKERVVAEEEQQAAEDAVDVADGHSAQGPAGLVEAGDACPDAAACDVVDK